MLILFEKLGELTLLDDTVGASTLLREENAQFTHPRHLIQSHALVISLLLEN